MRLHTLIRPALLAALLMAVPAASGFTQNLLNNGDFEGDWTGSCVGDGWTAWERPIPPGPYVTDGHPAFWRNGNEEYPEGSGIRCGSTPGNDFQRILGGSYSSGSFNGGIVQAVTTVPAASYDLDAQLKLFTDNPGKFRAYVGYDLTGQIDDPEAATVMWTPTFAIAQVDSWSQYSYRFTASGPSTSIWIRATVPQDGWGLLDIDNVGVTEGIASLISIVDGPTVSQIDATTYQVTWKTDIAADSVVDYGMASPEPGISYAYTQGNSDLVTSHTVVLSGLTEDAVYHYRVSSGASGYKRIFSLDAKFSTPYEAEPYLKNGSFELGDCVGASPCNGNADAWRKWGDLDGRQGPLPAGGPGNWYGVKASDGEFFVGSAASYVNKNGGLYQRIAATPGKLYTAEFDYKNFCSGANQSDFPVGTHIGIDPYGGVDPQSADIVWTENWNLESGPSNPWSHASVSATAESTAVTVFIKFVQKWPLAFSITVADNVTLGAPAEVATIGEARQEPNSTTVTITTGQVVTLVADAPSLETGFFYAQSPDGSAGIRVETGQEPLPSLGDKVLLEGVIDTIATTGERVLRQAIFTPAGTAATPIRTLSNKAIGGDDYYQSRGLSNQGLLMRVFGEVKGQGFDDEGFLVLYLDDGSANGDADRYVKVIKSDWFIPNVGDYVAITGVVVSESVNGNILRILRCRHNSVITDCVCFTCP